MMWSESDTVVVDDQGLGQRTQVDQGVPIPIVPRQPRCLEGQHNPHTALTNRGQDLSEARTIAVTSFGRKARHKPVPAEKPDRSTQAMVDPRASARELLSLAYYVEHGLIEGSVSSFDEAAAAAGLSRSRMTQILKMLDLEPARSRMGSYHPDRKVAVPCPAGDRPLMVMQCCSGSDPVA